MIRNTRPRTFQCSSASRKFLNRTTRAPSAGACGFQCSSASRKFLNQFRETAGDAHGYSFSALQRAENSSINVLADYAARVPAFQCSSASRKFLNRTRRSTPAPTEPVSVLFSEPKIPQSYEGIHVADGVICFSALQRAENSSIAFGAERRRRGKCVSVLFSEPKIPQSPRESYPLLGINRFSALQRAENSSIQPVRPARINGERFSALQRAENSSIQRARLERLYDQRVSVLFSEPKIPQSVARMLATLTDEVSVLFSEPKIPQYRERDRNTCSR